MAISDEAAKWWADVFTTQAEEGNLSYEQQQMLKAGLGDENVAQHFTQDQLNTVNQNIVTLTPEQEDTLWLAERYGLEEHLPEGTSLIDWVQQDSPTGFNLFGDASELRPLLTGIEDAETFDDAVTFTQNYDWQGSPDITGEGTTTSVPIELEALIDRAKADDVELVRVSDSGNRFQIKDLGYTGGDLQSYIYALTDAGYLPNLDRYGWETHRRTDDGYIAISVDNPDPSLFEQVFPVIVTAGITGGLGAGLTPIIGAGATAGIQSAAAQQILTGEVDWGDVATAGASVGAIDGLLSFANQAGADPALIEKLQLAADEVEQAEQAGQAVTMADILNPGDWGELNTIFQEAQDEQRIDLPTNEEIAQEGIDTTPPEITGPQANEATIEDMYNQDGSVNWEAVEDWWGDLGIDINELPGINIPGGGGEPSGGAAAEEGATGQQQEGAPGEPGGQQAEEEYEEDDTGGWPDPFPPQQQIDPNHGEKDDAEIVWRHTNPDGSVVAGNDVGEVWEVEPAPEDENYGTLVVGPTGPGPGGWGGYEGPGTGETGTDTGGPGEGPGTGPGGEGPGAGEEGDGGGQVPDGAPGETPGEGPEGPGPGPGDPGTGDDDGEGDDDGDGDDTGEMMQRLFAMLTMTPGAVSIPIKKEKKPSKMEQYDWQTIFRNLVQEASYRSPYDTPATVAAKSAILSGTQNDGRLDNREMRNIERILRGK